MITAPSFAQKLKEGRGLLGSWCTFTSFASAEVMNTLGFDFLVIDMQHCEITQAQFPGILGAFRDGGPTPVVRVPKNDYHIINWMFDQGVGAVLVPMVNSVEEAQRAVEAAKFPPLGRRSFGPYRASTYSLTAQRYMREADDLATLIIQIESIGAAREIEAILQIPGIDAVFLGPNDMAFSMLKPGQSFTKVSGGSGAGDLKQWSAFARTPEVLELCEEIFHKVKAASIPFGMSSGSIEEAHAWFAKGASMMTFGSDFLFMRAGAKQLCELPESKSATVQKQG